MCPSKSLAAYDLLVLTWLVAKFFVCLGNVPTSHSLQKSWQIFGQQEAKESLGNILARQ